MREHLLAKQKIEEAPEGALFVANHSGGKDSQAMFEYLYWTVPHDQLIVVHAHLPGVEWEGTVQHIHDSTRDIPVYVVQADKTFFEIVEARGMWPSPQFRQCTSSLKRDPISKFIRRFCKERCIDTVYNCIGLRAQESKNRAQRESFYEDKRLSIKSRKVYTVLPIHDYSVADVYGTCGVTLQELNKRRMLYANGAQDQALQGWPFIWTYVAGMSRHSCKLCIMSKKSDLTCSTQIDPENTEKYLMKEREINHKFIVPGSGYSLQSIYDTLNHHQIKIF